MKKEGRRRHSGPVSMSSQGAENMTNTGIAKSKRELPSRDRKRERRSGSEMGTARTPLRENMGEVWQNQAIIESQTAETYRSWAQRKKVTSMY